MFSADAAAPLPSELPASGPEVFECWAQHRAASAAGRPFTMAGATSYEAIWNSWLRFLAGIEVEWKDAQAEHVADFIGRIEPRAKLRGVRSTSPISRVRYQRLLRHVYAWCVQMGWVQTNPAAEHVDPVSRDQADSMTLVGTYWQQLDQHLPPGPTGPCLRDRALLLCLMDGALTASEVCELRLAQLERLHAEVITALHGRAGLVAAAPADRAQSLVLHLRGPREAQKRSIELTDRATQAMREWLDVRVTRHQDVPWVFTSTRGAGGLTPRAVFHVASQLVLRTARACGETGPLAHVGPNVLRNSAIVRWMESGLAPAEVARRAGVEDARRLVRLVPHCSHRAQEAWAAAAVASTSAEAAGAGLRRPT